MATASPRCAPKLHGSSAHRTKTHAPHPRRGFGRLFQMLVLVGGSLGSGITHGEGGGRLWSCSLFFFVFLPRCPASDGSLKPGTRLKQTKASTKLPLNPIKADLRRSPTSSSSTRVDNRNQERGALAKKKKKILGEIALPNFSLSIQPQNNVDEP